MVFTRRVGEAYKLWTGIDLPSAGPIDFMMPIDPNGGMSYPTIPMSMPVETKKIELPEVDFKYLSELTSREDKQTFVSRRPVGELGYPSKPKDAHKLLTTSEKRDIKRAAMKEKKLQNQTTAEVNLEELKQKEEP